MNFSQANTLCRNLCRKFGIFRAPHIIPLKYSRYGIRATLGHYDRLHNDIEINVNCMNEWHDNEIKETILHELVHTKCYQLFDGYDGAHDKRFHSVCDDWGLNEHVRKAVKT